MTSPRGTRVRHERAGIVAHAPGPAARRSGRGTRPVGTARRGVAHVSADRMPGRSLVTRRAIRDLVRTATLATYGVSGFSGGGPLGRLLERLGIAHPGLRLDGRRDADGRPRPRRRLRPARRRGRSPGRGLRSLRDRGRARPRARQDLDPDRPPPPRARPGAGRRAGTRDARAADLGPRRQRDGRRLMARRSCDGAGFLAAFRSAVASLEAHVDEINALNVFPVPDGDTGTNMLATVRAALEEADRAGPGADAERVAQAASFGALMGARGNSGVITSQILAGMAARPGRQAPVQRPRPRPCARRRHEDRVQGRRQAGRGHDPDRHPRGVGRRGRRGRARQQRGDRPRGDRGRRRAGRGEDAVPAADPARGARRRLGRAGPVPPVPGGPRRRARPAAGAG